MNRDVSAMEASAARASGTNEGRDAGGAPASAAPSSTTTPLTKIASASAGAKSFITTDAQGSAPSVDTHS